MKNPIYSASFICAEESWIPATPYFKKHVSLSGEIKSAKLHISSLGVFVAEIDGVRVGDDFMTPGWTNYNKRLQYFTYDITNMLSAESDLVVGVGNGWYSSRGGFPESKDGMYGTHPALIAAIELNYKDGTGEIICTDESWQTAKSECLFSGIYDGEITDANATVEFKNNAHIFDYNKGVLIPLEGEKTKEIERVEPKEILITPAGETLIDFGQELTGNIEFTINAKGGETVCIKCAEVLDKDGNFYNANYRTAKSEILYTAKAGVQTHKAKYTFFGFRYIKLIDWPEEVKAENFTAIVMHSDLKRTGYFKCGHAKLNQLYSNIIWGQRDNYLDIPTDCPQRDERLGWSGDTQVFARAASINFDTEKFLNKWLGDMASEQFDNGEIPHVIPDALRVNGTRNSTAWCDAACIVPWELYMAYGNKKLLKDNLSLMKKWHGYVKSRAGRKCLWIGDQHFGDWLGMDAPAGSYTGSTDKDLIASAYYYYITCIMAKTCDVLGMKSEDYVKLSERIRKAYKKQYIKRGKLTSDTQTAHVLTLHFGLVDDEPELKNKLGNRLVELIESFGDRLQTGFVGTPYLLDALTEIGRSDKAYTLLLQEKFPSWLFSVNMGATTIWEHWDSKNENGEFWSTNMNSFNHYAYGACAAWFYRDILGIKPTSPAYKTVKISPIPLKELGFAKARIETRSGLITSEWTYIEGGIRYCFSIPEGVTAEVSIDGVTKSYAAGTYTVWGK
jgi:alpha-L-rhamnosidase